MEPRSDRVKDKCNLPFISAGVSSLVFAKSDTAVVKVPRDSNESPRALAVECAIYERLGPHRYIAKAISTRENVLVLERLQFPLRYRLHQLRDAGKSPPCRDAVRWAFQIAEALRHVHACSVLQVDIGPHNVLLDWDENAKLSDFAGSSIDGSKPLVAPSEHSEHPDFPAATPSVQSEMFALGSTLYEVETTRQPYHDRAEKEILELFHVWSFPDTSALVLGEVITKCWRLEYQSIGEVVEDLERIRKRLGITEKGKGK